MEHVFYSNSQGMGFTLIEDEKELDFFEDATFQIGDITLKPSDETDLYGLYKEPIKFIGVDKEKSNLMVFYLGEQFNLFGKQRFYVAWLWLSPERIFMIYTPKSGRDYNLKNGIFK